MIIEDRLRAPDRALRKLLDDFVPPRVFDAHAHLLPAPLPQDGTPPPWMDENARNLESFRAAMDLWLRPESAVDFQMDALIFGIPWPWSDKPRAEFNEFIASETARAGGQSRALALAGPDDDPRAVAEQVRRLGFRGLKPYRLFARCEDTSNARLEEFAPEWMWELCHDIGGVLMLHIVRERAMADEENQKTIRRLCRRYPRCRLVLAHIARSFNYRHAREGLRTLIDLDNVWLDTSAVTETAAFAEALRTLGPQRVLFGTDYPVSEFRGKCVTAGDGFHWFYASNMSEEAANPFALVGLESLACLREACDDHGLTSTEVQDIFCDNALRMLGQQQEVRGGAFADAQVTSKAIAGAPVVARV